MHSCGLRTGEARALQTGQVDLQHGHIDIVWPKGNRSRRLPVTPQVTRVLDACDQQSRARFPGRADPQIPRLNAVLGIIGVKPNSA